MDLGLSSRAFIVTGASAGIGAASTELLIQEGARVVACARGSDRLESLASRLRDRGGEVHPVIADVMDPESSDRVRDAALDQFGRIDGIVHAAGGSDGAPLKKFSEQAWMDAFTLNTLSAVRLSMACMPTMVDQGWGRIVTIASTSGRDPDPRFPSYGASKAALMHASRAMSRAYSKHGILTNCVLPGLTRSEAILSGYESAAEHLGVTPDDIEQRMMDKQPIAMGRTGLPREVASAVVFLCSEAASWTTGTMISVDGGTIRDMP